MRIVHASADAPTVALDVGNDGSPEITDFARFAETGPAVWPCPRVRPSRSASGPAIPLARVTAFTTPALPEADIFLIATGLLGDLPRAHGRLRSAGRRARRAPSV